MVYNIMTCQGWSTAIFGGCSMAWLGLALIVILTLILRRQCDDGILAGTGFSAVGGFVGGIGGYIILISFIGATNWAFLAGMVGLIVGGWVLGQFMGSSDG